MTFHKERQLPPHLQYFGCPAGYFDAIARSAGQDSSGEGRNIRYGPVRRIGLVLPHNPEGLLATVIAAQRDPRAEGCGCRLGWWLDDFRARAPGSPVPDFSYRGGGRMRIVPGDRFPVGLFKTNESRLDFSKPFGSYEVAMSGDRSVRELLDLVFGILDKGAAHGGYRGRTGRRLTLSASMRFEASALVKSG